MRAGSQWLWDQHTCLPLRPDADLDLLTRCLRPDTGGFVSVNEMGPIEWVAPEQVITLGQALADRGWAGEHVRAVMSGNVLRVASEAWTVAV